MSDADLDPTAKMISGPINIVRLQGRIGKVPKVIYVFMDVHTPINFQRPCSNIFSKDISYYFAEAFHNNSKNKIDFFLELAPADFIPLSQIKYKDLQNKYIFQLRDFFKRIFNYDDKNNKVLTSKISDKLRLHYFDFREYFAYAIMYRYNDSIRYYINNLINNYCSASATDYIDIIIDNYNYILEEFTFIYEILFKKKCPNDLVKPTNPTDALKNKKNATCYYLLKIIDKYNNSDVKKKIINNLIGNDLLPKLKNLMETIKKEIIEFKKIKEKISPIEKKCNQYLIDNEYNEFPKYSNYPSLEIKKLLEQSAKKFYEIDSSSSDFLANLTDLGLLRRFLDKDYITNIITYTGAYHSAYYIYNLVKYFGFKITHFSYSSEKDLKKLNSKLKKSSDLKPVGNLLKPKILRQCSSMKGFPEYFS